ncbi:MAG: nitroreductase family protein [Candidatus Aenigmatarchaeota archaeon]
MEVYEAILKRRSIRKFKDKEIPVEIIDKLIDALIWAPSAGNLQARLFYFVFNKDIKEKLQKASFNQKFISEAPLVIVCCGDRKISENYGERGERLYVYCDVSASIENLMLLATSYGLGTCWVGAFDENKVKEILNLNNNLIPIAIIPVGYPNEDPKPPQRVSKGDAVEIIE